MQRFLKKAKRETAKTLSDIGIRSTTIQYRSQRYRVPLVHGIGAGLHMITENRMDAVIRKALADKPGAVIDVGVNIGLFLIKLRNADLERQYIGFEPNPLCGYYVQELIRLNRFRNARIFPFALSDNTGVATFYAGRKADKMGSLNRFVRQDGHRPLDFSFDVITQTGDDLVDLVKPEAVSLLKIDVEGSELSVLTGLVRTIQRHRPWIYCEIWPLPEDEHPDHDRILASRLQILDRMTSAGYTIFGQDYGGRLLKISTESDMASVPVNDFIFLPDGRNMTAGRQEKP